MSAKGRRAVFLDRDGTINVEVGYLSRPEDFVLIDGSAQAIKRLNEAGFLVVVVSNQSGVARGYFGEREVARVNETMAGQLEGLGARLDAVYYCPHYPEGTVEKYRRECNCRKPGPGMVRRAQEQFDIDVSRSYVVGDHRGDIVLAKNVGARSILVVTGHGAEEIDKLKGEGVLPDYVTNNLAEAVDRILSEQ
ncbi:MAG: D-glycero-beta-D-manno-heptose 1,7-bisphosphate 7-phosphatase [Deltaproteobacteria bacterium]|nr:D-glycero-beta-D-manno-heptose 1,7-bisphosphate 7-phosphatase [Candidatus Zymogenaceae bacterium]